MTTPGAPAPAGLFFGWKVVASVFVMAVFAWGVGFYGPTVYLHEIHATRGWSVSLISAAITAHFLWSALLVAFLGEAYHRFGIAPVTYVGIAATALGVIGWAVAAQPWQLFAAAGLTGIGWAATSGAAINAMVSPWFDRRRVAALSHAYNGASIGGVAFTPLWVALIAWLGFPGAAMIVAAAVLAVLVPLTARYISRRPEDLGLAPDGGPPPQVADARAAAVKQTPRLDILKDPRFFTLSLGFSLGIFAQMGLIAHLVTRLAPVIGDLQAALLVSIATVCAVIGRLGLAAAPDSLDRRRAASANFAMQSLGVLLLTFGDSLWPLVAGCVLFGLGIGNLLSLPPLILQVEHNRTDVVRAVALFTAVNQIVYAFAPGIFGVMRDMAGSYTGPFLLAGAAQLAAAVIVASSGRSRPHVSSNHP